MDSENLCPSSSDDESNSKPIRGISKSGRTWKTVQKSRFSSIRKGKGFTSEWSKKQELKLLLKNVKENSNQIIEEKKQKKIEKRQRREENERRRQENARKSEIVQVVSIIYLKLERNYIFLFLRYIF